VQHSHDISVLLQKARKMLSDEHGFLLVSIPKPEVPHWRAIWYLWSHTLGRKWLDQHHELTEAAIIETAQKCGFQLSKKRHFFFGSITLLLFICQ